VYKKVRRALTRTACNALTVRVASAGLGDREAGDHARKQVGPLLIRSHDQVRSLPNQRPTRTLLTRECLARSTPRRFGKVRH
jgi:hypothetical protein